MSVTIPSSLIAICDGAFAESNLKTVYVNKGDTERIKSLISGSGFDVTGVEFIEVQLNLLPEPIVPEGEFNLKKSATQVGIIVDEDGMPKATIQVKVSRAMRRGISKVTVTVIDMYGKKYNGRGEAKVGTSPAEVKINALKLTCAAKTATFKGSFKVWTFDEAKKKLKPTEEETQKVYKP